MKQNKKQNWIVSVIIISAIISLGIYDSYINSTHYFCSHNPEKCVCEEWIYRAGLIFQVSKERINPNTISTKFYEKCHQFRKKTPDEIQIDDCNSNPREDKDCKCEFYDVISINKNDFGGLGSWRYTPETLNQLLSLSPNWIKDVNCIKSRPKTDQENEKN